MVGPIFNFEISILILSAAENRLGRKLVSKGVTGLIDPLKSDYSAPNYNTWQFSPTYPEFADKGISTWSLEEIKACNNALVKGHLVPIDTRDSNSKASKKTRQSRHVALPSDQAVDLGTPEGDADEDETLSEMSWPRHDEPVSWPILHQNQNNEPVFNKSTCGLDDLINTLEERNKEWKAVQLKLQQSQQRENELREQNLKQGTTIRELNVIISDYAVSIATTKASKDPSKLNSEYFLVEIERTKAENRELKDALKKLNENAAALQERNEFLEARLAEWNAGQADGSMSSTTRSKRQRTMM